MNAHQRRKARRAQDRRQEWEPTYVVFVPPGHDAAPTVFRFDAGTCPPQFVHSDLGEVWIKAPNGVWTKAQAGVPLIRCEIGTIER